MFSAALAQAPSPPSATDQTKQPSMSQSAPASSLNTPAPATAPNFVASQKPDQWLASKFNGTDVLGADNQKIGDVSDILFDKSGKVDAIIVKRGRFPWPRVQACGHRALRLRCPEGPERHFRQAEDLCDQGSARAGAKLRAYQAARTTTGMGTPSGLGGPVPRPSSNTPPASSR